MLLTRDDWYETSRDVDWTFSAVDRAVAFPTSWSGTDGVPEQAWQEWEEPFRVSYRDYVRIQREKEAGVKAVSNALTRAGLYEKLARPTLRPRTCTWARPAWSSTWR